MFETREKDTELELNQGILYRYQNLVKPWRPRTRVPIILVNINRKILSLITKARIQPAAESFLSPSQSDSGRDAVLQTPTLPSECMGPDQENSLPLIFEF
jgi:hypothetical protein